MNFRRSSARGDLQREWHQFLTRHAQIVGAIQLPDWITASRATWDDFLMHGYLDHHDDPSEFRVDTLSVLQFQALRTLFDIYAKEFSTDYAPIALLERNP